MQPGIDQGIVPFALVPQTLLAPTTKEVVTDLALGGTWINRNPRQVNRTGVNVITPGYISNDVSIIEPTSPVLIRIVATSPPCGLNVIQKVVNKWQSTSPGLIGQTQTPKFMDMVISTINALDKSSGISTPTEQVEKFTREFNIHYRCLA